MPWGFYYTNQKQHNMSDLSNLALEIAVREIGKQEIPKGSNWGPDVEKYLHSVGINFPASWCMAFVYWCFDQASFKLDITNPLYKTGGVISQWQHSVANQVSQPSIGDIFIMDFGHGLGHTGIIESIDGEKLHTIEGNTNDTGSREGYEVCRKIRTIQQMKGFLSF